jgi:glycosyltransferase involved in cell wall biosynthesis
LTDDLALTSVVEFMGWNSNIMEFLSRIDAFVLSSRSEGLPLSLIEGMAAGKPVISTAVGGIPEIVESARCGWLCPAGNPNELARVMLQAAQSPHIQELGVRARDFALESFSESRMVDNYECLFQGALSQNATLAT